MNLSQIILKFRTDAKLSQEQLAEKLKISRQAVQKWENGTASPDLPNLVSLAKLFGTTLDSLVFGSDTRIVDELENEKKIKPEIQKLHSWEVYSSRAANEYRQCIDEGLDISGYKDLFDAMAKMPVGENKEKVADVIFNIVLNSKTRSGYEYNEPSELEKIKDLRNPAIIQPAAAKPSGLKEKITGAWYGRICGCLLGKPIEGISTKELYMILKGSDNYPMRRYIHSDDITAQLIADCKFRLAGRCYSDAINCAPVDDDTNYTVLYQELISEYGRDFTPGDVSRLWVAKQPRDAYCTAERVAFRNFIGGYYPPESAVYKNPFREWIGAQIRGDYFGYINPGDPEKAAEMAFRDACISHTKNGIYGEMFVAAMLACAAVTDDIKKIILCGLSQIPQTSRLYEALIRVLEDFKNGVGAKEFFDGIHTRYNEDDGYDWCHTIPNAEIVTASLLYGGGDYGKSICMAVEQGFDTDCNGATVGSVLGMRNGIAGIPEEWTEPVHGELSTSIFGVGKVSVESLVEKTLSHIEK